MSKTPKKLLENDSENDLDDGDDTDIDDLPAEAQDVIAALAELEGATTARWKIHRIEPLPDGKEKGYCGTLDASQFSQETIQKRFGKGRYRVIGHTSNGQYIKGGYKVFDIAYDPPLGHDSMSVSSSGSSDAVSLLQAMNKREQDAADRRRELLLVAIPTLPALMTAIMGNRQQTDPVQLIALMQGMQPKQQFDMSVLVTKLIEIAVDKSAGGSGETNWLDLAKEALTQVGPLLGARAQEQVPTIRSAPVPQAQISVQSVAPAQSGAPSAQPAGEQTMLALLNWLRKTLHMLIEKAQQAKDPSLCADWVLDDVPDGVDVAQFLQYVNAPDWFEKLAKFDARVVPYRGWFAQFREDLLAAYEESLRMFDEAEPAAPPTASEHKGTATVHELHPNASVEFPADFDPPGAS